MNSNSDQVQVEQLRSRVDCGLGGLEADEAGWGILGNESQKRAGFFWRFSQFGPGLAG